MEFFFIMALSLAFLFIFFLSKWNEIILLQRKGLPPGTMGWPFFGETHDFLKLGPEFMKKQRARYGSVFKTHILGSPTIISMDPELNRYILLNESKGLVPGYPKSMLDILGTRNIAAVYGSTHKHLRSNLLSLVGNSFLKQRLFPTLLKYMSLHLSNWDPNIVDIQQKTMDMALFISFTQIAEAEWSSIYDRFKIEFDKLFIGSLSLPINLPGSNYYQGLKGRRNVVKILKQVMNKRRASSVRHDDMLEHLLSDEQSALNDEEIIDQIITILNSGYETVSTTSMMAVKYLHDNQEALHQLRKEHFAILTTKGGDAAAGQQQLDWDDYKSMRFTQAVVLETLRLATVVNGVLRKTTQDLQLNGFIVPKGWKIYVYTREINYDPILYPEPLKFNPWRWMDDDKKLESHKYCLLFGRGSRMCPGKELGIVTVCIFLHYFVTQYRWEEVGGEKIVEFPRVEAPNGYHIRVMKL